MTGERLNRCAALILLGVSLAVSAHGQGKDLNHISDRAVQLVKQAVHLAEADKPLAAIRAVKTARLISPNYLRAHIEYQNIKTNYLDQYDEVEAEYQSLRRRFPDNPVYLMALSYRANGTRDRGGLVKIVRLAPEWSWAHYAQALLVKQSDSESAARELRQCINLDPSAIEAYELLIDVQERRLHRIDDAIRTAEEFAEQAGVRPSVRLPEL